MNSDLAFVIEIQTPGVGFVDLIQMLHNCIHTCASVHHFLQAVLCYFIGKVWVTFNGQSYHILYPKSSFWPVLCQVMVKINS